MYHVFTGNANFEVDSGNDNIEFLLVGGGGGSFGSYAGGGGAGGVAHATAWPVTPGTYPIVVGDGGTGSAGNYRTLVNKSGDFRFGDIGF